MPFASAFTFLILSFFSILFSIVSSASLDSPCTDQLQRCGSLVEDFERQLQDLKNLAFRSCFTNTACVHEKIAFDDCFAKSLQAVRAPFGDNPLLTKSDFLTAAEDYRPAAEHCFSGLSTAVEEEVGGGAKGAGGGNGTAAGGVGGGGSEDVTYLAGVVYGTELVDRLWGLPNGDLGNEQVMDQQGGCRGKDANSRVFGGGISRIVPPGADQLNNLNTSCTLSANELACYRRALDHDPQYRLLMTSRDRAQRSCLQNARLQSETNCQFIPSRQIQTCICNAREEMNARMQSALLSCVQHSPVAQLYSALVSLSSNGGLPSLQPLPDSSARFKPIDSNPHPPMPATSLQITEDPLTLPSTGSILTQGSIVSGQCFCACPQKCPYSSSSIGTLAANNDLSTSQIKARLPTETAPAATAVVVPSGTQTYRPMPWYYQPLQTALSAEAGIANGFERFFNGQSPLKRKKREEKEHMKIGKYQ